MAFWNKLLGGKKDWPPEVIESTVTEEEGQRPGESTQEWVERQTIGGSERIRYEAEQEVPESGGEGGEEPEGNGIKRKQQKEEERVQREADRRERERLGREKEAEELARDIAKLKARGAKAEAEKDIREAGGTRYAKIMRGLTETGKTTSKFAGMAYKLGTLGGPVKMRAETRDLYSSKGMRPLTGPPTGMRKLTSPSGEAPTISSERMLRMVSPGSMSGSRIGRAVLPPTTPRQQASPLRQLGQGVSPLRQIALLEGQRLGMGMRGQVQLPKAEQEVLTEISRKGGSEVPSQIVKSLSDMGISQQESVGAIKSLLQKRVVRQSSEKFGNEFVLEVSR